MPSVGMAVMYTWAHVGPVVDKVATLLGGRTDLTGVYGVPRGGLVLAVALSHRLGLPLVSSAGPGVLWVDDIVETGKTLQTTAQQAAARVAWVNKVSREDWDRVEFLFVDRVDPRFWVVFPWESMQAWARDASQYRQSRQG